MSETHWKIIGKVKEAHGLKGELYILIFSGEISWLKQLKTFQLEGKNFTVERAKPFKKGFILKTQGIDDRNQAEAVEGHSFAIGDELLVAKKGETIFLKEILHFEVTDKGHQVGQIVGFSSNGAQDLLQIKTPTGIFEVPFVEAFILNIDFSGKTVSMDLPEGLLE